MKNRLVTVVAAAALAVGGLLATATASSAATANTPCTTSKTFRAGTQFAWTAPTTSSGSTDCYLVQGNQGNGVKALQRGLKYCEYISVGSSGIDGSFGPATKSALKTFQSGAGITVDGEYGNQTRDRIYFLDGAYNPGAGDYYFCN